VACVAHVLGFSVGYVHVDAQQHVLEAFCSVVHEAQLEALLVEEALGKGPPEGVGGQSCLIGELELREELLKGAEDATVGHASVPGKVPEAAPEDVQMPQHLHCTVEEAIILSRSI
jgi:hypothetical protein